ncbi:MAG: hypothetical protein IJF47_05350, partial [Candidatus Methanomethylophilaceae archaeon]|nr:hypothetical protein [Candidatus Methanomethylophilaceae archaeon]
MTVEDSSVIFPHSPYEVRSSRYSKIITFILYPIDFVDMSAFLDKVDRFFGITEKGSSWSAELRGG